MASAVERAYAEIRQRILSGQYPSGSRLKEEELAAEIGVSRTPIREALRRLSAGQIVRFGPSRRAYVASWSHDDVDQLFTLRAILEGYGIERAATRITEEEIAALEKLQNKMEKATRSDGADTLDRIASLNNQFHNLLFQAARSDRIALMLPSVIEPPIVLGTFEIYTKEELDRSQQHHREIIEALKAGDPGWASSVMHSHVYAARSVYLRALERKEGEAPKGGKGGNSKNKRSRTTAGGKSTP